MSFSIMTFSIFYMFVLLLKLKYQSSLGKGTIALHLFFYVAIFSWLTYLELTMLE